MIEIYNQEKGITLAIEKGNPLTLFKVFEDASINNVLKKRFQLSGQVDLEGNIQFKAYIPLHSKKYFDEFSDTLNWLSEELQKI